MKILPTELEGLRLIQPRVFEDLRGSFVKTYHTGLFREAGIDFQPGEDFFSISKEKVLRGMHFQTPPQAQTRLVYCLQGAVLDVVVDLRKKSKTFKQVYSRELNDTNREMLYIPTGFAHGFLVTRAPAIMVYSASPGHSPANDTGITWNSIDFKWPITDPILSDRDRAFPALRDFSSPF